MSEKKWVVRSGNQKIVFDAKHGPLPASVSVAAFDGRELPVLAGEDTGFSMKTSDGRTIVPVLAEAPVISESDGVVYVSFRNLAFTDSAGTAAEDFQACFDYEFHPDGTAFCSVFFLIASIPEFALRDFRIVCGTDLAGFDDIRWALLHRPAKLDGSMIQDLSPKRFLERGREMTVQEIAPLVSFNCFREGGEALYAEFFMEGGTTLSGKKGENATRVAWKNASPVLEWNFQTADARKKDLPFQFRNHWGWVIKTPPRTRHLPPMTMYHYFDNFERYPSDTVMEALEAASCQVLILHENWRLDLQNDGVPFDEERFRTVAEAARRRNIRLALYIRGNENSATETSCAWFDRLLRRNFDGLYMDYGSPFGHSSAPDETYIDGRIHFRRHYMNLKKLRERIGPDGIFFSHTGPSYSALGMNFITGYVSGEGERGLLIRGRREHEYFSMAAVSCGTMWTAAFPEYSTERMVPFLAAAGQYPHNPLGTQFATSSLAHPREPGVNDLCFRPLWKLWGMLREEKDLSVFNDWNSAGIFPVDAQCGHCLMISQDGRRALCLFSNFSSAAKKCSIAPDWSGTPFRPDGKKCYRLTPDRNSPGVPQEISSGGTLALELAPYGCGGFYFSEEEPDFTEYLKPYPLPRHEGVQWLAEIEEQRTLRSSPPRWKRLFLTVKMPPQTIFGYEDSLLVDLYDNDSWVVEFEKDGSFRKLLPVLTKEGKSLFTGDRSEPIDLGRHLSPGRHSIGIYATHLGEPFYSFFSAELSDGGTQSYELVFRNELEEDRAFLRFDVIVPG